MQRIKIAIAFAVWMAIVILAGQGRAAEGDEALIRCADGTETTYEKDQCRKGVQNKTMSFEGEVFDVVSAKVLTVKLNSDNYARVSFKQEIANQVYKGDTIRFSGKVDFVGSGILFQHRVKQAVRLP
jgi:hypothetical protein